MSQKYTLSTARPVRPTLTFSRTMPLGMVHLSDGTLVFAVGDGTSGAQNYALYWTSDRSAITKIDDLNSFQGYGAYDSISVARDDADNIYVVGGNNGSGKLIVRAYAKGTGKTWTLGGAALIAPASSDTSGGGATSSTHAETAMVWCRTGGGTSGAGHLLIESVQPFSSSSLFLITVDAGALLAGAGPSYTASSKVQSSSSANPRCDLEPDGFGATTVAMMGYSGTGHRAFVYTVSSAGALTQVMDTGSTMQTSYFDADTVPAYIVRVGSGTWAYVAQGYNTSASKWSVQIFNASGLQGNIATTGSPTNMPSATRIWTLFRDPTTLGKFWIITAGTITSTTIPLLRLGVTVSGTTVAFDAAATADDTLTGTVYSGDDENQNEGVLRSVKSPAGGVVDWQVTYAQTSSTYTTVGDATTFNSAPTATTITSPATGGSFDCTSALVIGWPFTDPDSGDAQSKYDVRYRVQGAGSWTTPAALTGVVATSSTATIPAGTFTTGQVAEIQVQTYDRLGVASGWGSSWLGTAASPPPAPTFTSPAAGSSIGSGTVTPVISAPSLDALQWQVLGDTSGAANATVVQAGSTITDSTARTFTVTGLANGVTVHVQARIRLNGLWSSWADLRLPIAYTPPATPTLTLTYDSSPTSPTGGSLLVVIVDPVPTGQQPAVSGHDVYVDNGDGLKRRAIGVAAGSWRWWTPVHGRDYGSGSCRVKVVAVGANGTTAAATS